MSNTGTESADKFQQGERQGHDIETKEERRGIPGMGITRGRQTVRGFAVKSAVIQLKCSTQMSNEEIATAIGRSSQWVRKVWKVAVEEAAQAAIDPEKKKELQAWMIHQIKITIIKSQKLVDEHAAYGALVIKGVDQLGSMVGTDLTTDGAVKKSLQEIADEVDIRSPLVLAKLEGVKADADARKMTEEL